jgi:hypothetical protein
MLRHTQDLGVRAEPRSAGDRTAGLRLRRPHRLGQPVTRGVEAAEDLVAVEQRVQADTFVG